MIHNNILEILMWSIIWKSEERCMKNSQSQEIPCESLQTKDRSIRGPQSIEGSKASIIVCVITFCHFTFDRLLIVNLLLQSVIVFRCYFHFCSQWISSLQLCWYSRYLWDQANCFLCVKILVVLDAIKDWRITFFKPCFLHS